MPTGSEEPPAEGAVTGLLLAGDEGSTNSLFRSLPTRRAPVGVQLEAAVEQTVADAGGQLGAVLEAFIGRAQH